MFLIYINEGQLRTVTENSAKVEIHIVIVSLFGAVSVSVVTPKTQTNNVPFRLSQTVVKPNPE